MRPEEPARASGTAAYELRSPGRGNTFRLKQSLFQLLKEGAELTRVHPASFSTTPS